MRSEPARRPSPASPRGRVPGVPSSDAPIRIDPTYHGDSHADPSLFISLAPRPRRVGDPSAGVRPRRDSFLESLEDRCLLSFSPAVSYPVGVDPQAVVTGDFNGDGRLDLAVANASSNTVSILLGNANGTFQAAQNSATGAARYPWPWATSTATASSTSRRPMPVRTTSACCWATATAPSRPATNIGISARCSQRPWPWATSTATASSTSGSRRRHHVRGTPGTSSRSATCCSATATARSRRRPDVTVWRLRRSTRVRGRGRLQRRRQTRLRDGLRGFGYVVGVPWARGDGTLGAASDFSLGAGSCPQSWPRAT